MAPKPPSEIDVPSSVCTTTRSSALIGSSDTSVSPYREARLVRRRGGVTLSCARGRVGCLPLVLWGSGPFARATAAWPPLAPPAPPARPFAGLPNVAPVPGSAVPAGSSVPGVRAPVLRSASYAVRVVGPDVFAPRVDNRFSLRPAARRFGRFAGRVRRRRG